MCSLGVPKQLLRKFKATFGNTLFRYIFLKRVQRCKLGTSFFNGSLPTSILPVFGTSLGRARLEFIDFIHISLIPLHATSQRVNPLKTLHLFFCFCYAAMPWGALWLHGQGKDATWWNHLVLALGWCTDSPETDCPRLSPLCLFVCLFCCFQNRGNRWKDCLSD